MLVMLFNQFGSNDCYGQGFPSRWKFAEDKLRLMNGKAALRQMVNTIFDAREFIGKEQKPEKAAEHLNQYLKFDGYELVRDGEHFKVRETGAVAVQFDTPFPESQEVNHLFIEEQVRKCDKKIEEGDFGGAIRAVASASRIASAAGRISAEWKGADTARGSARLAPFGLASAMARSIAAFEPDMTTWPPPLSLAA